MKTGRYRAWLSTVAGQSLTGSDLGTKHDPLQMMHGVQTRSAADVRELDIHWAVHRIVWTRWITEVHTKCQRIPQMMTQLIVWAFLVSVGHITMIKERLLEPKHG